MPERFLTLEEVCNRAGYTPSTVHTYRAMGKANDLKLPPLVKRGDKKLGCLESVLDAFLLSQYGGNQ